MSLFKNCCFYWKIVYTFEKNAITIEKLLLLSKICDYYRKIVDIIEKVSLKNIAYKIILLLINSSVQYCYCYWNMA